MGRQRCIRATLAQAGVSALETGPEGARAAPADMIFR
jgi:hypothetical protein